MKQSGRTLRAPALISTTVAILILLVFYLCLFNYTEPTEMGIARNQFNGETWTQKGGMHITLPWVWVAVVDLRPMRVGVPSAGKGYSAKLVQFVPEQWREFVEVEGWRYWWWANRFSFNSGYREEYRGLRDILRGYAYGVKKYSFFQVLSEYQN
jgi:hypothetical protein